MWNVPLSCRSPFLKSSRVSWRRRHPFIHLKRVCNIRWCERGVVSVAGCKVDVQLLSPFLVESPRFVSLLDSYDMSSLSVCSF